MDELCHFIYFCQMSSSRSGVIMRSLFSNNVHMWELGYGCQHRSIRKLSKRDLVEGQASCWVEGVPWLLSLTNPVAEPSLPAGKYTSQKYSVEKQFFSPKIHFAASDWSSSEAKVKKKRSCNLVTNHFTHSMAIYRAAAACHNWHEKHFVMRKVCSSLSN